MEFVESIKYQSSSHSYRLAHGISVRREKFGLLFYNSKGPKLTFVRSGPWILPSFFSGELDLKKWIQARFPALLEEERGRVEERLLQTFSKLLEKELIVETTMDS
jgi:putative mycofactocin binding protein MftB